MARADAAVASTRRSPWSRTTAGSSRPSGRPCSSWRAGRSRFFPGSWHAWRAEQAARELALGRAIERQQAEVARLERFVDALGRRHTGSPGAVAGQGAREDRAHRTPAWRRRGALVPVRRRLRAAAGSSSSSRTRGSRSARRRSCCSSTRSCGSSGASTFRWSGPNGSGKTTLIETLTGQRPLTGGRLRTGHNVHVGFLSQHTDELGTTGTVLEATQRATGLTPNRARALLGRFLFGGELAEKPLAGLSGGERRRLALAILVSRRRQRADPRRADQPPRPGVPRGPRGRAAARSGLADPRLPRPRAARRGRHADGRASRTARCAATSAAGRSTCACASSARPRARNRRQACPQGAMPHPARTPAPAGASRSRAAEAQAEGAGGAEQEPPAGAAGGASTRSRRPRRRWRRSSRSWPTRRRGRRSTKRPRARPGTRRPSGRSRRRYAQLEAVLQV